MALNSIDFETAKTADGLRMTVVKGVPNPWGEAVRNIFFVKQLPWQAVYHDPFNQEMAEWFASSSAPSVVHDQEAPVSHWQDILTLAERLNPTVNLLPESEADKEKTLEFCKLVCDPEGLNWYRRLNIIDKGLKGEEGGFDKPIAQYLASKYGYQSDEVEGYHSKIITLLNLFTDRLETQQAQGSHFLVGDSLTAADFYLAASISNLKPLPENQCKMFPPMRAVFGYLDQPLADALSDTLIKHRDFIYSNYVELPIHH